MPLLEEYEQRTAWKHEPIRGHFSTHPDLQRKICSDGDYRAFPGSTAVFRLDRDAFRMTRLMQENLHCRLDETGMLAKPLPASTLHMTLHDLTSPEQTIWEIGDHPYAREVETSLDRAQAIVHTIQTRFAGETIAMIPDRIVNMVSKSLVLLLKPASERDYSLLMDMYRPFDAVKELSYPLTPHITLAYFRPGMIDGERLGAALHSLQPDPGASPVCNLYPESLTAQSFSDMAHYRDVPMKICFCCDGGMNRSVMCASMLNHFAKEQGWPLRAEARSAYQNTHGQAIPEEVWHTLERHGIGTDRSFQCARYLENRDYAAFSQFAVISAGAMDRVAMLGVPDARYRTLSSVFFGIRDPAYESSYEQAYADILERMDRLAGLIESGQIL